MADTTPTAFAGLIDLASADLGGRALACSDDFFAGMENLVQPEPAVFDPDAYTERGKLMDGWESRRKRVPGHDWCIVELGVPGRIRGVDIDTSFFMGNHPPYASVEACSAPGDVSLEHLRTQQEWTQVLAPVPLQRGSHNLQAVTDSARFTHVRLRIFPDGGVARLRIYGDPQPVVTGGVIDLACTLNGGRALACSDMFFSPPQNLLLPAAAKNMGGGWETRRSRPPGADWVIVALGAPGTIERVVFDTNHFKGNFPHTLALDGLYWPDAPLPELVGEPGWTELIPASPCQADHAHEHAVSEQGPWTHVRMRLVPDGGVSRLRVYGRATQHTPVDAALQALNGRADVLEALTRCCGSSRWAAALAAHAPFASRTQLHGLARSIWWEQDDADWLQAFTHHPRIGADPAALRAKFGATADWSAGEQAGVQGASESVLAELAQANVDYERRFGHIFIVCASGLSAAQMLGHVRARMHNTPQNELRIAAGEQAKITALRLDKLLRSDS